MAFIKVSISEVVFSDLVERMEELIVRVDQQIVSRAVASHSFCTHCLDLFWSKWRWHLWQLFIELISKYVAFALVWKVALCEVHNCLITSHESWSEGRSYLLWWDDAMLDVWMSYWNKGTLAFFIWSLLALLKISKDCEAEQLSLTFNCRRP